MHYAVLAGLLLLFGFLSVSNFERTMAENHSSHVQFVAGHMRAYGAYVAAYAQANPSANGGVSDAAIALPTWLARPVGMTAYVRSGQAFIYYMPASVAQANEIARSCGGSLKCGVTRSRSLFLPGSSAAVLTGLPTPIPANGALVLVL